LIAKWRTRESDLRAASNNYGVGGLAHFTEAKFRRRSDDIKRCADELEALVQACAASSVETECLWSEDDDGLWQTACGREWQFIDDGPIENRLHFCIQCGKHVALSSSPVRPESQEPK
jgi:hypothetical protein